jgi:hypothetical protein
MEYQRRLDRFCSVCALMIFVVSTTQLSNGDEKTDETFNSLTVQIDGSARDTGILRVDLANEIKALDADAEIAQVEADKWTNAASVADDDGTKKIDSTYQGIYQSHVDFVKGLKQRLLNLDSLSQGLTTAFGLVKQFEVPVEALAGVSGRGAPTLDQVSAIVTGVRTGVEISQRLASDQAVYVDDMDKVITQRQAKAADVQAICATPGDAEEPFHTMDKAMSDISKTELRQLYEAAFFFKRTGVLVEALGLMLQAHLTVLKNYKG